MMIHTSAVGGGAGFHSIKVPFSQYNASRVQPMKELAGGAPSKPDGAMSKPVEYHHLSIHGPNKQFNSSSSNSSTPRSTRYTLPLPFQGLHRQTPGTPANQLTPVSPQNRFEHFPPNEEADGQAMDAYAIIDGHNNTSALDTFFEPSPRQPELDRQRLMESLDDSYAYCSDDDSTSSECSLSLGIDDDDMQDSQFLRTPGPHHGDFDMRFLDSDSHLDVLFFSACSATVTPRCAGGDDWATPTKQDDDISCLEEVDDATKDLVLGYMRRNHVNPGDDQNGNLSELLCSFVCDNSVLFDQQRQLTQLVDGDTSLCFSSNAIVYGCHEWSIKVNKCNDELQEVGILSADCDAINDGGVLKTDAFGARAVYGSEMGSGKSYYASFNDDGHVRICKDLKSCWKAGDEIKVKLDMAKGKVTFYLNGAKVRKVVSVQKGKMFYPFVSFVGDCVYELISGPQAAHDN